MPISLRNLFGSFSHVTPGRRRTGVVLLLAVFCSSSTFAQTVQTVWTGGNATWNNAANWDRGIANNGGGQFFNAVINGSGSDTIVLDLSPTIDSLTLGTGEILQTDTLVARTLTIGSTNATGTLTNAGTINFDNGSTLKLDVHLGSTNLANSGSINLDSAIAGGASLVLDDGGKSNVVTLSGKGALNLAANTSIMGANGTETLNNTDNTIQGVGTINGLQLINGGTIIANGGTMTISGNAMGTTNSQGGTLQVNAGSTLKIMSGPFINSGTVMDNGTFKVATTVNNGGAVIGPAKIAISGGVMLLNGDFNNNTPLAGTTTTSLFSGSTLSVLFGTFTNSFGARLNLIGSGNTANLAALSNAGTLRIDDGSSVIVTGPAGSFTNFDAGTQTLSGGTYVIGGTLQFAGANIVNIDAGTSLTLRGSNSLITPNGTVDGVLNLASNAGTLVLDNRNFDTVGGFDNSGTFGVQNGSAFTTNNLNNSGTLTLSQTTGSGTSLSAATVTNGGGFIQIGADTTLTTSGDFSNDASGSLEVDGGTSAGLGGVLPVGANFNNAGVVNVLSGSVAGSGGDVQITGTFTNSGSLTLAAGSLPDEGGTLGAAEFINSGMVNVGNAAKLSISGNFTNDGGGTVQVGGTLTAGSAFDNFGKLDLAGLSEVSTGLLEAASLDNAGGSIQIGQFAALKTSGNFTNDATGILDVDGSSLTGSGGTLAVRADLDNAGVVNIHSGSEAGAGGNVQITGLFTNSGSLTLLAGSDVDFGGTLTAAEFTNSGTVTVGDFAKLTTSGNFTNQVPGTVEVDGTLRAAQGTFDNFGILRLGGESGFLEAAILNNTGGSIEIGSGTSLLTSGDFTNDRLGVVDVDGSTSSLGFSASVQVGGNLTNEGSFSLLGGLVGPGGHAEVKFDFINSGTLTLGAGFDSANAGSLEAGGLVNTATINIDANASLTLMGNPDPTRLSDELLNQGTINLTGENSTLQVMNTADNEGTIFVNGDDANLVLAGGAQNSGFTNNGSVFLSGQNDNFQVNGSFTNSGSVFLESSGDRFDVAGSFFNDGTVELEGTGGTFFVGGDLVNDATVDVRSGNAMSVAGDVFNNATISFDGKSTLSIGGNYNNSNGSFLEVGSGDLVTVAKTVHNDQGSFVLVDANGTLTSGVYSQTGASSGTEVQGTLTTGSFSNDAGSVKVTTGGQLTAATGFSNADGGTIKLEAGSMLNVTGGDYTQTGGSTDVGGALNAAGSYSQSGGSTTIELAGTITVPRFTVSGGVAQGAGAIVGAVAVGGGSIQPGKPGTPGTLTINGTYTQDALGTLIIDLGGTGSGQFGVLSITGAASLDGTVDFTTVNSFTPAIGDDFMFLLASSVSGDFANLVLTNWSCPANATCTLDFAPGSVTLDIDAVSTAPTPEPGTLLLIGAGMLGIGAHFRRRKSRASGVPLTLSRSDPHNIQGATISCELLHFSPINSTCLVSLTGEVAASTPA